jgi:hypothetical protein
MFSCYLEKLAKSQDSLTSDALEDFVRQQNSKDFAKIAD